MCLLCSYWTGDCSIQMTTWKDKKLVTVLSSHPEVCAGYDSVNRYLLPAGATLHQKTPVDRPMVMADYSDNMAGKSRDITEKLTGLIGCG